mmetsp:Transcript_10537/g.34677  ORF Transcript_10537/g.34677 Transcript_10537/m.34677 type:complete len:214 (+) Transcript_10537:622-1263(+)
MGRAAPRLRLREVPSRPRRHAAATLPAKVSAAEYGGRYRGCARGPAAAAAEPGARKGVGGRQARSGQERVRIQARLQLRRGPRLSPAARADAGSADRALGPAGAARRTGAWGRSVVGRWVESTPPDPAEPHPRPPSPPAPRTRLTPQSPQQQRHRFFTLQPHHTIVFNVVEVGATPKKPYNPNGARDGLASGRAAESGGGGSCEGRRLGLGLK